MSLDQVSVWDPLSKQDQLKLGASPVAMETGTQEKEDMMDLRSQ